MKRKAWPDSWPTNTVETVGGCFEEVETVREELLEILRAGPGEAARREVAGAQNGPTPSRWTLRTIRASVDWLTEYTVSGVWRVLHTYGLELHENRTWMPRPVGGEEKSSRRRRVSVRRPAWQASARVMRSTRLSII